MCVAKPATQRPKLPSVGRLGLVEPSASADLDRLGWNTDAHVELLWSLSRAPDADAALRAMVRLADALGRGLGRTQPGACSRTKALRGPAVRCARFVAGARRPPGRPSRSPGICWRATSRCRRPTSCGRAFTDVAERRQRGTQRLRCRRCGSCTATGCWCWRPSTWRRRWRTNPCCRSPTVGEHLSDLADAALGAALTVATRSVCGDDGEPPAAGGDRDGQVRRARTELRQRRRRHLRRRGRRRGRDPGGRRDDAVRVGRVLRGRRGAAAGGQARPAGAHAGLAHRLLPALGQDLGVPGAAEGPARRRRRRTRASSTSTR